MPSTANVLTDDNIRANSFFRKFDNDDLYGPNGNTLTRDWHLRAQLLGDGIPALWRAMGRNALSLFAVTGRNVDMNNMENGWPQQRLDDNQLQNRWFHSGLKNMAYLYTHELFNELVSQGGLQ